MPKWASCVVGVTLWKLHMELIKGGNKMWVVGLGVVLG